MTKLRFSPQDIRHAIVCYSAFYDSFKIEDKEQRDISASVWAIECHKVWHVYKACGLEDFDYAAYLPEDMKDEITS